MNLISIDTPNILRMTLAIIRKINTPIDTGTVKTTNNKANPIVTKINPANLDFNETSPLVIIVYHEYLKSSYT